MDGVCITALLVSGRKDLLIFLSRLRPRTVLGEGGTFVWTDILSGSMKGVRHQHPTEIVELAGGTFCFITLRLGDTDRCRTDVPYSRSWASRRGSGLKQQVSFLSKN